MVLADIKHFFDTQWVREMDAYKQFHYATRMWLRTWDEYYKKHLEGLKDWFLNKSFSFPTGENVGWWNKMYMGKERSVMLEKYRLSIFYTELLFYYRYAWYIYSLDKKDLVKSIVSAEELTSYAQQLFADGLAVATLSTYAINFFYALDFYLINTGQVGVWNLVEKVVALRKIYTTLPSMYQWLEVYYLTHAIIGATDFYAKKISPQDEKFYRAFLQRAEEIISTNYVSLKLDIKLEFMVCCRIVGYTSFLNAIIKSECVVSIGKDGFLIDLYNTKRWKTPITVAWSEHRNVLYLLSEIDSFRYT